MEQRGSVCCQRKMHCFVWALQSILLLFMSEGNSHVNENSLMLRGPGGAAKTHQNVPFPPPQPRAHYQLTLLLGLAAKWAENLQKEKLASGSKMPGAPSWRQMVVVFSSGPAWTPPFGHIPASPPELPLVGPSRWKRLSPQSWLVAR